MPQNGKLIEPGKWYSAFDQTGRCTAEVYDRSYWRMIAGDEVLDEGDDRYSWVNAIHPDDLKRVKAHYQDCLRKHPEGQDYDIEYRLKTARGYRWVHDFALCTRYPDGTIARCDGVVFDVQDIFDREQIHQTIAENNRRILLLEDRFESLYDVDLASGRYVSYVKGDDYQRNVDAKLIAPTEFFEDLKVNIQTVIYPDDRSRLVEHLTREHIRTTLSTQDHFEFYYRILTDRSPLWFKIRVVYKDASQQSIIVGVFNAQEEVIAQEKEAQALKRVEEIVQGFANEYEAAYLGNLQDGSYRILNTSLPLTSVYLQQTTFPQALKTYVEIAVHPSDRARFSALTTDLDTARQLLEIGEQQRFEFRYTHNGDLHWSKATLSRIREDLLIIGLKNCDEEMKTQRIFQLLTQGYDAIYTADLDVGLISPIRSSRILSVGQLTGPTPYTPTIERFAQNVAPAYQRDWLTFSDPKAMQRFLADADSREFVYELPGQQLSMRRVKVLPLERHEDGTARTVICVFEGIDDARAHAIRLQNQMFQRSQIINALSADFTCVDYVELFENKRDDRVTVYRISDRMRALIPQWIDERSFSKRLDLLCETLVYPPDRAQFYEDTRRETMVAHLQTEPIYTINFRLEDQNELLFYQGQVSAVREGDQIIGLVAGLHSIDAQMRQEKEQQMRLESALAEALLANQRNSALHEAVKSGPWSFEIDRDTHSVTTHFSDELRALVHFDLKEDTDAWCEHLHPEDHDRVLERFHDALYNDRDDTPYNDSYRLLGDDGQYRWFNSAGKKIARPDGSSEFFGMFIDITEQMEKERATQQALIQKTVISDHFIQAYSNAYYVDLKQGNLTCLHINPSVKAFIENAHNQGHELSARSLLDRYIDNFAHPDDRLLIRQHLAPDHIRKQLEHEDGFSFIFRDNVQNGLNYYRCSIIRGEDADHVGLAFKCITDEILEQQEQEQTRDMANQQRHIKAFGDMINAALWSLNIDPSNQVVAVSWSNEMRHMLGYEKTEEDFPNVVKSWTSILHPDDRAPVLTHFNACLQSQNAGQHAYDIKYRLKRKTGEYCWYHAAGRMEPLPDGYRRLFGVFIDISAEKQIEEQQAQLQATLERLQEEALRTDLLYETCKADRWIYEISTDDRILSAHYADSITSKINDAHRGDPMGWLQALHPDDRDRVTQAFMAAIQDHSGKTTYDETFRAKDRDQRTFWSKSSGRVFRRPDGTGEFIGMSIDISAQVEEQEKHQQQLEEALAMAQSANRAKSTFLNNMSHDIRTPMNAIIGYTGLAASHIDRKEQVQDYLSKISQASDHLLSLINDVLDMSRIESGKMHLDEKEVNLSEIIHTLRDIVQADVHAKQLDFYIDAIDVNDEQIICDKLRLNQVLLNVLSNAIKYTATGGTVTMLVIERTVKRNGYATYEFCIKDNGMGMDEAFLKTIFDPFTRMKSSTVSGIQGTGLGMAITKNIVDMLGGKIDIQSAINKGTEVTLTLDFKLQNSPKGPIDLPELKGLRGLVVDDDMNTCMSVAKMIRDIGMRDEWCTSGKEAVVRAIEAHRIGDCFHVYIIDWLMPDMNGIETTRRIRRAIGEDASIIILTAYDWTDIEEEAREAGVNAFVSKPMFPSDLQLVLNSCLRHPSDTIEEPLVYNFAGKKILLVEDNDLNREIATEILEEAEFEVDTAQDGHLAVEKIKAAQEGDYDLILMDVQMPIMDGYEATKQIRALNTPLSKIPILAMTANAFEEDRKLALNAGMDAHIAKPIDITKLKDTLAHFL